MFIKKNYVIWWRLLNILYCDYNPSGLLGFGDYLGNVSTRALKNEGRLVDCKLVAVLNVCS